MQIKNENINEKNLEKLEKFFIYFNRSKGC